MLPGYLALKACLYELRALTNLAKVLKKSSNVFR